MNDASLDNNDPQRMNEKLNSLVQRCETLYNDLNFTYVRQWKEAGKKPVIGFMPVYVPRELIHSFGMLPVGILGGGSNLEIIKGDAYYQSYICHIPRSTIELGLSGRLDFLDGMLFPAICDVIRNLSGMWQLMFPGTYVKYLDFPQNFSWDIGGEFYLHELQTMVQAFERLSGCSFSPDALRRSISLYNENRECIEELYQLRSQRPHLVTSAELYLLMRASYVLEVQEHTTLIQQYLAAVKKVNRPVRDTARVLISGMFCEQPSLTLLKVIEQSGCSIVDDDWVLAARYIEGAIPIDEEPLKALAKAYLQQAVATASRYESDGSKGAFLLQRIKKYGAEGVIFAAPSFCDPALLERPMLQRVLAQANIPYTTFKYAEDTGQYHVIKEQTGTFADSVKLWVDVIDE